MPRRRLRACQRRAAGVVRSNTDSLTTMFTLVLPSLSTLAAVSPSPSGTATLHPRPRGTETHEANPNPAGHTQAPPRTERPRRRPRRCSDRHGATRPGGDVEARERRLRAPAARRPPAPLALLALLPAPCAPAAPDARAVGAVEAPAGELSPGATLCGAHAACRRSTPRLGEFECNPPSSPRSRENPPRPPAPARRDCIAARRERSTACVTAPGGSAVAQGARGGFLDTSLAQPKRKAPGVGRVPAPA